MPSTTEMKCLLTTLSQGSPILIYGVNVVLMKMPKAFV